VAIIVGLIVRSEVISMGSIIFIESGNNFMPNEIANDLFNKPLPKNYFKQEFTKDIINLYVENLALFHY
jgi:hypothetical protein